MKQLSAASNSLAKWMAGSSVVLLVVGLAYAVATGKLDGSVIAAAGFAIAAALGLHWERSLADEVVDLGDALLVARGDERQRFELKDIERIDRSPSWTSRFFTVHFRRRDPFGDTINFWPGPGVGEPERNELNLRIARSRVKA